MKIEGFFRDIKTANQAVDKLKGSGLNAVVDINEHFGSGGNGVRNVPGTHTGISLSGVVFDSSIAGSATDTAPLLAASPMVSGMGGFEEIADINCRVIVDTDETEAYKAKRIIGEMGGTLDSPNVKRPELEEGAETKILENLNEARGFLDNSR
ncbi:MAG TPA: hypothetical protein VHT96_04930 [Clostridia bacterium]|nr:hypothetical protein [Clostridia bacterium]